MSQRDFIDVKIGTLSAGLKRALVAMPLVTELDPVLGERATTLFKQRTDQVSAALLDFKDNPKELPGFILQAEELLEESLAYLTAACVRKTSMDEGVTDLALAWLDGLSGIAQLPRVAVVIPALEESTRTRTTVMRLQVPSHSIWGLPVAVHEFGHFVAARITSTKPDGFGSHTLLPVEQLLEKVSKEGELPKLYLHGHELFADAFAIAVAGPAYAQYCIRYRFPPQQANLETPTHPTTARRMRLQIRVLKVLSHQDAGGFLAGDADAIEVFWNKSVHAVGLPSEVPVDDALDKLEDALISIVLNHDVIKRLHYREHTHASALAESKLFTEQRFNIAQILNAAWVRRTKVEQAAGDGGSLSDELAELADRAIALMTGDGGGG